MNEMNDDEMLTCKVVWKRRMMVEKKLPETDAAKMAQSCLELIEHMRYQHVMLVYYKQDGTFCLEQGTLIGYKNFFQHEYSISAQQTSIVYWNVRDQEWRRFRIGNLKEWKPILIH